MASGLKRVSGLWLKDGRAGKFMSGETDADIPAGTRLLVFKNTKKVEGDKQPDYILNVAPEDPGCDRGRQGSNGSSRRPEQPHSGRHSPRPPDATPVAVAPPQNYDDSEIPF